MEKEVAFPVKRWSVLTETELLLKMDSRRSANLLFLASGMRNAQRVESTINPKNFTNCCGTRHDLGRQMK